MWSQDALAAPQAVAIAVAVLALRLLAMRDDWRAPTDRATIGALTQPEAGSVH